MVKFYWKYYSSQLKKLKSGLLVNLFECLDKISFRCLIVFSLIVYLISTGKLNVLYSLLLN